MSTLRWLFDAMPWLAAGFVLGAIAGVLSTVEAFQAMHRNSLPQKQKELP